MRRILSTLVAAALIVVGTAIPAVADQPDEYVWTDTRTEIDPCSGEPVTAYFTFTVQEHQHGSNTVMHTDMYAETSSGYIANGVENIVVNKNHYIQVFNWVNDNPDNGDRALIKGRIKVDLRTGNAAVSVETKCIGQNA